MSLEEISDSVMESLKVVLKEKLIELVPIIIKEIAPELVKYAKDSIEEFRGFNLHPWRTEFCSAGIIKVKLRIVT